MGKDKDKDADTIPKVTTMANRLADLDMALKAMGIPFYGVSKPPVGPPRIDFKPEATPEQRLQGNQLAGGWDWSDQPDDTFETKAGMPRVLAALIVRMSTAWADVPALKKARIQNIIDHAGLDIINNALNS